MIETMNQVELVDSVLSRKGANFIGGLKYQTIPKAKSTGNPFYIGKGKTLECLIRKVSEISTADLGHHHARKMQNKINKTLEGQTALWQAGGGIGGKPEAVTFKPGQRAWGERIPGTGLVIHPNGSIYLEVFALMENIKTHFVWANINAVDKDKRGERLTDAETAEFKSFITAKGPSRAKKQADEGGLNLMPDNLRVMDITIFNSLGKRPCSITALNLNGSRAILVVNEPHLIPSLCIPITV